MTDNKDKQINSSTSSSAYQPKYIWKQTNYDGVQPFSKYSKAHRLQGEGEHQSEQQLAALELRQGNQDDKKNATKQVSTKITTFTLGSKVPHETIIEHAAILKSRKKADGSDM